MAGLLEWLFGPDRQFNQETGIMERPREGAAPKGDRLDSNSQSSFVEDWTMYPQARSNPEDRQDTWPRPDLGYHDEYPRQTTLPWDPEFYTAEEGRIGRMEDDFPERGLIRLLQSPQGRRAIDFLKNMPSE